MKAVVFTSCDTPGDIFFPQERRKALDKWKEQLSKYNDCISIGLVYVFITDGYRGVTASDHPWTNLQKEHLMRDILADAIKQTDSDKIQIIGVEELKAPMFGLERLAEDTAQKSLSQFLLAEEKYLYYDSPKMIEAIIRIARGNEYNDNELIFRIDEDVKPKESAFKELIRYYENLPSDMKGINNYHFFSGGYSVNIPPDLLNDFSVRTNVFAPVGVRNFIRDQGDCEYQKRYDDATAWIDQLMNIGANPYDHPISGAGLSMSLKAIRRLPPFTNMSARIIWIDDHLKRILHEALGDLPSLSLVTNASELYKRCTNANFAQDRNPEGITQDNIDWGRDIYLDRLVRGCLMDALMQKYREFINLLDIGIIADPARLHSALDKIAEDRLQNIIGIWSREPFNNYPIKYFLNNELIPNSSKYINQTIEDLHRYLQLLRQWPRFVALIERLKSSDPDNQWLFRPS